MENKHRRGMFAFLGLTRLPWVARVYLILVFMFTALVILSAWPVLGTPLGPIASESLKMVLAALVGALSQAGERRL